MEKINKMKPPSNATQLNIPQRELELLIKKSEQKEAEKSKS